MEKIWFATLTNAPGDRMASEVFTNGDGNLSAAQIATEAAEFFGCSRVLR